MTWSTFIEYIRDAHDSICILRALYTRGLSHSHRASHTRHTLVHNSFFNPHAMRFFRSGRSYFVPTSFRDV